jgi:hypothetical protein
MWKEEGLTREASLPQTPGVVYVAFMIHSTVILVHQRHNTHCTLTAAVTRAFHTSQAVAVAVINVCVVLLL